MMTQIKKIRSYFATVLLLTACIVLIVITTAKNSIILVGAQKSVLLISYKLALAITLIVLTKQLFNFLINNKDITKISGDFFATIISFLIFMNALISILRYLGIDTSQITTIAAFLGMMIGIGCKKIIQDMLFGVMLAAEDILHPFDFICVKKKYGLVKKMTLTHVVIEDGDENLINIRNSNFKEFNNAAFNLSTIIVDAKISVSYPLNKMEELIEQVLVNKEEKFPIFKEGPEYIGIEKFANGYMYLRFVGYCKGKDRKKAIISLNKAILDVFSKINIDLIYPQQTNNVYK